MEATKEVINLVRSAILGAAIGDAIGLPYQFKERDSFECLGMTGMGTFSKPAGYWSDDTSMTLATMDGIVSAGKIDTTSIADRFVNWMYGSRYTPGCNAYDIGRTTRDSVERYAEGFPPSRSGGYTFYDNGNGALMRILPLAFLPGTSIENVKDVGGITHNHVISHACCIFHVIYAKIMIQYPLSNRNNIAVALKILPEKYRAAVPELNRLLEIEDYQREQIKSSGFVVDTLMAAMWCFITTSNYRDCILKAVNLGGDTDTIAGIAGGLAGIRYGFTEIGIPPQWLAGLAHKDDIEKYCRKFAEFIANSK